MDPVPPAMRALVRGVAGALQTLTLTLALPAGPVAHDKAFDERARPLGADPMRFFFAPHGRPPAAAFSVYVIDLVLALDLSTAELLTGYVLLETLLRTGAVALYTYTVRPLFLAAVGLAMKLCTETEESVADWVAPLAAAGYTGAAARRLGRMERLSLQALKYRFPANMDQYLLYAEHLVRHGGSYVVPPITA